MRATTSLAPPGANGTINRTGFVGYGCGVAIATVINPVACASFPRTGLRLTSPDASPSANGTIRRTGLVGYCCALAPKTLRPAITASETTLHLMLPQHL